MEQKQQPSDTIPQRNLKLLRDITQLVFALTPRVKDKVKPAPTNPRGWGGGVLICPVLLSGF